MFFRKKGEDPWDWKPERKRGQAETPQAQPSGETQDWSKIGRASCRERV